MIEQSGLKSQIISFRDNYTSDISVLDLETLICKLGLNNEKIDEQPPELHPFLGNGLKLWQYPIQIAKLINKIQSKTIASYLEIGARHGGTFMLMSEIIKHNNSSAKLYACDIIEESANLLSYHNLQEFKYIHQSSLSEEFKNEVNCINPEFVFIDGLHTYDAVKSDFSLFTERKETKYIVFHDICNARCPGVVKIWNEVKNHKDFISYEITDQYPGKTETPGPWLGIGLLIRK